MTETFNCPSCGAPLNYDAKAQEDAGAIPCPYCGESVIVPAELRRSNRRRVAQPSVGQPAAPLGGMIRNCLIIGILIAVIITIASVVTMNGIQASVKQAVNSVVAVITAAPTDTPFGDASTSTAAVEEQPTRQPTLTPTPEIDATATFEAESTRTAQNALFADQRNWPVVLQEKFLNNQRNWNTGQDNNNMAIEDLSISGSKYTWQMTTKKSMGSFSYPDMADQMDMYVSVDLQVPNLSGNAADQAGITFRDSVKDKTFYFFGVNPLGTYSLTFYNGSDWSDLISTAETNLLKEDQVNHLAVSIQGSQILLSINNSIVNSYEDSQAASGIAGLGVNMPSPGEEETFIFTNFYVRAPTK